MASDCLVLSLVEIMNTAECNKNHSNVIKMPEKKSYTRIPNEVLEKLYAPGFHLSGEQRAVFDFIMRKTLGWGKDSDVISLGQFEEATGIAKKNIIPAIKSLSERNIISILLQENGKSKVYEINTNIDNWAAFSPRRIFSCKRITVLPQENKSFSHKRPTKEIYKETITKEIKNPLCPGFENPDDEAEKDVPETLTKKPKKYIFKEEHAQLAKLIAHPEDLSP